MRTTLWVLCVVVAAMMTLPCAAQRGDFVLKPNMDELKCAMPDENYRLTGGAPGMLFIGDEDVKLELAFKKGADSGEVAFAIEIQEIGTRTPGRFAKPDDLVGTTAGTPLVELIGKPVTHPFKVTFGEADELAFTVEKLPVPKRFGTFALILVRGDKRQYLGNCCRLPQPREYGHIENTPVFGEGQIMADRQFLKRAQQYYRMGIRGWRSELSWSEVEPGKYVWDDYDKIFNAAEAAGLKVMVTLGGHPRWTWAFRDDPTPASGWQPNTAGYGGTGDWLCQPKFYPQYETWIKAFCERYWKDGQGALWGLENYNEPWEGGGISGWARDMIEYREIQRTIARGARAVSPDIRLLAASSIMNTEDKLYSDGSNEFDQYVDVFTDHYVVPANCYGPMVAAKHGKWSMETETWFVNTEYLLPQAVAQFMASGQKRIAPWHPCMLFDGLPGVPDERIVPAPIVAATAAFNYFVTGKEFERVVFLNHLPWVFQFGKDDDKDALLVMFGQLMSIGDDSPKARLWAQVDSADGGQMEIDNSDGLLKFHDLAGNPTYVGEKTVTLPMTVFPTYILCEKGPKAAAERIKAAKITGKRPVEIIPRDFDRPLASGDAHLTVDLHNCLNREITGKLTTIPPKEIFNGGTLLSPQLTIPAGATVRLQLPITAVNATPLPGNAYPCTFKFESDAGNAEYAEVLHVTAAPKAKITIDGNLDDWKDVPGVTVIAGPVKADRTELYRRPWLDLKDQLPDGSFAEFKLAWDEDYLYVAARVRDKTPDASGPRLEGRDENAYFHTAASDKKSPYKEFLEQEKYKGKSFADVPWVYCASPEADSPYRRDRLQIAISASPKKPISSFEEAVLGKSQPATLNWHDLTPTLDRVPFGFHVVPDTDYEYSLYLCGDGKSECWRQLAPGVPRIHDYPRQPRGEKTTGPVKNAKHVVKLDGDTFTYELAIPREEIPTVKLEPGTVLGIMLRAGDNHGLHTDLGVDKASTKLNGLTLHPYWERTMNCGMQWTLTK